MPLMSDGLPVSNHAATTLNLPQKPSLVDIELDWQEDSGQLAMLAQDNGDPLLDLPWQTTRQQSTVSDDRWNWPYAGFPLSGWLGVKVGDWQVGLENILVSGQLGVLIQGRVGKGNAVLNFGPGKLSMDNSQLSLQLAGEAKQADLILYARLPAQLSGSLSDPALTFEPGALLRSKGGVIDSLDIDEIRQPLAGIKITQRGVDGRLQAILQAHESELGDFMLHMDGLASDFLPDAGYQQWRYWGKGSFTSMNAAWDIAGKGERHDSTIALTDLSTDFDQLQYGTTTVEKPRLILDKSVVWGRDAQHPPFSDALLLDTGQALFTDGSVLPSSTLKLSVDGRDPTYFLFKDDLRAGEIDSVRVSGR